METIAAAWIITLPAVFVLPLLLLGTIRKVKARLQNRIGAPVLQPLLDMQKLLQKHETISTTASWAFRFGACANLAAVLFIAFSVPWIQGKPALCTADLFLVLYLFAFARFFTLLTAMDTGSAFGAFAASREATLSFLVEPAAVLSLVALAVAAGTTDLNAIFSSTATGLQNHPVLWVVSGTAFLLASIVELSRMPVDDPTTHLELTMVHEALVLEASGKNLALIEMAGALRLAVLFGVSAQCYLRAFPAAWNLPLVSLVVFSIAATFAVAMLVGIFEALSVKLNWRKVPEFVAYSITLALMASLIALGMHVA